MPQGPNRIRRWLTTFIEGSERWPILVMARLLPVTSEEDLCGGTCASLSTLAQGSV